MAKLLSSLPVGATVKFGKHSVGSEAAQPIVWIVADKNHDGYPANSVTLIAKQIIDLRAFDGAEASRSAGSKGYNNFGLSNLKQWLNSDGGANAWYTATDSYDAPPSASNVTLGTEYQSRPGFLYHFANSEKALILQTTISVHIDNDDEDVTAKVFIPSNAELGYSGTGEIGSTLYYFQTNSNTCTLTPQAFTNTPSTSKPSSITSYWWYWTRSAYGGDVRCINATGNRQNSDAYIGDRGVRPMLNLTDTATVSDFTDSDGCYTFSATNAPTVPTNLQVVTSPVYTSKPCSIKWNASTDPNGTAFSYKIHLYYNGVESGNAVDVGTATTYTLPSVKSGVSSVGFGVEAVDTEGHSNGIASVTSVAYTNNLPIISGANSDLGVKNVEFSQTYTVTDADNAPVTVTEYIDNVKIRSYVVTLGATNTFAITGNTWQKLANGIHTLKITATDGIDTATRVFTFVKTVNTLVVKRATPMSSSTKPSRLVVTVVKNIPPEAIFKVEACNNGFDAAPAWEDITSSITRGQTHTFANTVKTAENWGVNIRVTVNRNGGEGACYITEIGGNFE